MSTAFDAEAIERFGWRQGAVLGTTLATEARKVAPSRLTFAENDWLIVTSHDCDVVNDTLDKEPTIEVLRAAVMPQKKPDKQQVWGRSPRQMHFSAVGTTGPVVLAAKVHDRWSIPRELLALEAPQLILDDKARRVIAEWLAKRYIRAAFPTSFDARWRSKMKDWTHLLEEQSEWVQGIYVRLNTMVELEVAHPYRIHLMVAAPAASTTAAAWAKKKAELESRIDEFWKQFGQSIECVGVEVVPTSRLTLADIEPYQRFDADWVSFADDSPATPPAADMQG